MILSLAERVNDVWRFSIYDIGGKIVAEYGGVPATDEGGTRIMENVLYYVAMVMAILSTVAGLVFVTVSVIEIAKRFFRGGSGAPPRIDLANLLNGLVQIFVGGLLFWNLSHTLVSALMTIGILSIFSLLEHFARKSYSRRLESL